MVVINYHSIRHVFRVQKHILALIKLSNFNRGAFPLSLERHVLRSVIIKEGGEGGILHRSAALHLAFYQHCPWPPQINLYQGHV